MRADLRALDAVLARWAPEGPMIAVGAANLRELVAARGAQEAADDQSLPAGAHAAVICGALPSSHDELRAAIAKLAASVKPGGVLVLAVPTPRSGLAGLWARVRAGRALPLEDLCAAMVAARASDVRAEELGGSLGLTAIWGRLGDA